MVMHVVENAKGLWGNKRGGVWVGVQRKDTTSALLAISIYKDAQETFGVTSTTEYVLEVGAGSDCGLIIVRPARNLEKGLRFYKRGAAVSITRVMKDYPLVKIPFRRACQVKARALGNGTPGFALSLPPEMTRDLLAAQMAVEAKRKKMIGGESGGAK